MVLGALTQLLMVWSAETWRTMQAFMLGNTALLGWPSCAAMAAVLAFSLPVALLLSRVLDALSLGEDAARTLGVPLGLARAAFGWCAGLGVCRCRGAGRAGRLCGSGCPTWCALVRCATSHPVVACQFDGRGLAARGRCVVAWVLAPQELPVGVLTAVMGGRVLCWPLIQRRRM